MYIIYDQNRVIHLPDKDYWELYEDYVADENNLCARLFVRIGEGNPICILHESYLSFHYRKLDEIIEPMNQLVFAVSMEISRLISQVPDIKCINIGCLADQVIETSLMDRWVQMGMWKENN